MADFNDSHKVERTGGKYFDEGIHEVKVGMVEFGHTNDDREFCDITVFKEDEGEEMKEAKVRFWFHTDGAIGYSFGSIRNMFVHNASDSKKEATRERFNKIKNTAELETAMEKVLVGDNAQVWLRVQQDGTYDKNGEQKPSYKRDLFGYKPSMEKKTETAAPAQNAQPSEEAEQNMAGF